MENSKSIICPNCGAISSNFENCEYCGSILVKLASLFQAEGKDVSKELKELGIDKSAYVNPVILDAIENSIIQCQKYNTEIECLFVYFERGVLIEPKDGSYPYYEGRYEIYGPSLVFRPNSAPVLKKQFFMDQEENRHFKHLENSRIGRLFEFTQEKNSMICTMQMDNDIKTTAQFLSHFFSAIFGTADDKIFTSTFVNINGIEYLIATDKQNKRLKELFNEAYGEYLEVLRGEATVTTVMYKLEIYDKIIYNIYKELENVSIFEFRKKRELQQRYQDRFDQIANREHFINTDEWKLHFRYLIHLGSHTCQHWIDKNATEEDIKKIAQQR